MTLRRDTDDSDFFDEVQDKVEQDIFLQAGRAAGKTPGAADTRKKDVPGEAARAPGDIQVDIVDSSFDLSSVDVDDSFLEEVDVLVGKADEHATLSDAGSPAFPSPSPQTEPLEDQEEDQARLDDLVPFQEDDRYLGELIGRDLVRRGEPEETPPGPGSDRPGEAEPHRPAELSEEEDTFQTRTMGEIYAKQGHYDRAIEIYENLLENHPFDHEITSRLAEWRILHERTSSGEPAGVGTPARAVGSVRDTRSEAIERLEAWLNRVRAAKEKRCLRSS